MQLNTLTELIRDLQDDELKTVVIKNHDYANKDALSNFKIVADNMGINAEQVCLTLINVKVARLNNLIMESKVGKNESIDDTILDMRVYLGILQAIRNEK